MVTNGVTFPSPIHKAFRKSQRIHTIRVQKSVTVTDCEEVPLLNRIYWLFNANKYKNERK